MPVPGAITDLSSTASANSPQGTEPVGPIMNQYIQAAYAFIAQLNTRLPATLPLSAGGTGGTDAPSARTNLGLGTMALQNIASVAGPFVMASGQFIPTPTDIAMVQATPPSTGIGAYIQSKTAGTTSDSALAGITFEVPGSYGIKLGLRGDGVFAVVGYSSIPYRWYSSPNGDMVAAGNITALSDRSVKKNIKRITGALGKMLRLRGVTYDRRDIKDSPRQMGLIAQEAQKEVPELVIKGIDGKLSIAYGNAFALSVESTKELYFMLAKLDKRLTKIEKQLATKK